MRILLAILHYAATEADPKHSSVDATRADERRAAVRRVIEGWRGLFGRPAVLDIETRQFLRWPAGEDQLDIALVTMPGCSLLDAAFLARHDVTTLNVTPENPRMLGFEIHDLFGRLRGEYDMFAYSEDDLLPADPDLFAKIAWFAGRSGGRRMLSPNRFEWDPAGRALKTYIDGDLPKPLVAPMLDQNADDDVVRLDAFGRARTFRRARNPHSGFFALTQSQLGHWMRQPHWGSRNSRFISPLESAATLGVGRTFSLFKPFGSSASFLELQHLDIRFSAFDWPWASEGLAGEAVSKPLEGENLVPDKRAG